MDSSKYLLITEVDIINKYNNCGCLTAVNNYLWINTIEKNNYFSITDAVGLTFDNGETLYFKINDEDTGLCIMENFDFASQKKDIESQFTGQVKYVKIDATKEENWNEVVTQKCINIMPQKEESRFLNNQFIISFEDYKLELFYHPTNGIGVLEWED